MTDIVQVLEGRIDRKKNNALTITFADGPGEPLGASVQGGGDSGVGKKLGVLFGFKNGGTGTHLYTPVAGEPLCVQSRDQQPTVLTRPDGTAVGQIQRGEVSIGTAADGAEVLRWIDHPQRAATLDAFPLQVLRPDGVVVAELDLVRTLAGWSLGRDLVDATIWWGRAGRPLPIPFLGTSVKVFSPFSAVEHEQLIASCIDMAVGLRPYGTAMRR